MNVLLKLVAGLGLGLSLVALARASDADTATLDEAIKPVAAVFALNDGDLADADLLAAGREMAQVHLARARALLPAWLAQARAETPAGAPPYEADRRLYARVVNELALWSLDSPGAEFDAVQLQALKRPGLCRDLDTVSEFAFTLRLWQGLPPAQRDAGVQAERQRLARWGEPRPGLPGLPSPLPDARLRSVFAEARAADGSFETVMPPVLANLLFSQPDWFPQHRDSLRCEAFQWQLRDHLRRQSGATADALAVMRHAVMRVFQPQDEPADALASGAYPRAAAAFGVEGRVVVELLPDPKAGPPRAAVLSRQITVPGLPGVRAAAFEGLLDEASLVRARATPADPGSARGVRRVVEVEWKLQ